MWDFTQNCYHHWLEDENLVPLLPDVVSTSQTIGVERKGKRIRVGVGIHDSSSALASYQLTNKDPFILVSTGTWSISLNPFTTEPLSFDELNRDCLNFLDVHGRPVKASRLFLGSEFDRNIQRMNEHFHKEEGYYKRIQLDVEWLAGYSEKKDAGFQPLAIENSLLMGDVFGHKEPIPVEACNSFEEAYHQLIWNLVRMQVASIRLACGNSAVRRALIDGGFVDNLMFVAMLRHALPDFEIEVSTSPLGSALGAALVVK